MKKLSIKCGKLIAEFEELIKILKVEVSRMALIDIIVKLIPTAVILVVAFPFLWDGANTKDPLKLLIGSLLVIAGIWLQYRYLKTREK